MDLAFKHVMFADLKELRLKFLFDHVRNYGIAATVMAAGFYLFRDAPDGTSAFLGESFSGIVLVILGFLMLVLNLMHPIWLMVLQKVKMLPYLIISFIIFALALDFFWASVQAVLNSNGT